MKIVDKRAIIAVVVIVLLIGAVLFGAFSLIGGASPDFGGITDAIGDFFADLFDGSDARPTATPPLPPPAPPTPFASPPVLPLPAVPPDPDAHPLVGTWAWTGGATWRYVFEADGTGTRDTNRVPFTWSVEDGILIMELDGGGEDRWSYDISGQTLTLTSVYFPGVVYQPGTWTAPGNTFTYNRR